MSIISNLKIKGFFKVWNNAFGSDCEVSMAIVNDMDALLAKIAEGQEILLRYKLKAVQLEFHPDTWVGSHTSDDLKGLVVTQTHFSFECIGYVGTVEHQIACTRSAIADLRAAGERIYSPEFAEWELRDSLENADLDLQ
jgi:hypothetical protein